MELFVAILMGALTVLTAVAYWHPHQYQKLILPALLTIALLMFGVGIGWSAALAKAGLIVLQSKVRLADSLAVNDEILNLEVPSWALLTFFAVVVYLALLGFLKPFGLTARDRNEKSGA